MSEWTREDWALWTAALHRPSRVDDEECPPELALIPWWLWAFRLAEVYGGEVTRETKGAAGLPDVLLGQTGEPVPDDWCRQWNIYNPAYGFGCNGTCGRFV